MPTTKRNIILSSGQSKEEAMNKAKLRLICRSPTCLKQNREDGNDSEVEPIILPYVYRYLVNELAAMNIKLKMDIK